jgi:iron-sulfur cluster insertion protein
MCDSVIESVIEAPSQLALTDAAVAKVADLIAEGGNPELKLRVYVNGGGCSGFQYGFAFDDEVNEDDFKVEKDGITLLVDAMSMQYLSGAEIGYEDGLEGSRFIIKNPNAATTCGCGSSFSA